MLKILLRKTISSLMLMTLALFLVSFNNNNFENNNLNNFETQQNILNTEGATVTTQAVNGLTANTYVTSGGASPSFPTFINSTTVTHIDFDWGSGNVLTSGRAENVGVIFYGYFIPQITGTTYFYAPADDGVRIYVDSMSLIYNDWVDKGGGGIVAGFATTAGVPRYFELHYYENGGGAHVELQWSNNNGASYSVVPSSAFTRTWPTSTMSFNSNGGSTVSSIIAERNKSFTLPANPTRTGYSFIGWNYSSGTAVNTSVFPLNDTTVNAVWNANSYIVALNKNGGTGGTDSVTATYDSNMPAATLPSRTGYNFAGYFDALSGGTQYYLNNMTSARTWNKTSATTLYARWTPATYTVTFNRSNGTGGTSSVTATYDAAMPNIAIPTRSGLTFLGYFDSITGGNQYYNRDGTSTRNWNYAEARSLFARWAIEGTTTFSTVGNFTWTVPAGVTSVNYLVVGGGGAGGFGYDTGPGGGGGAGGFLTGTTTISAYENIQIKVGAGGLGNSSTFGSNGEESSFGSIVAFGGGGGGASRSSGRDGASGGGAGGRSFTGGTLAGVVAGNGISGQGNNGGVTPQGSSNAASGGGGAGGPGIASTSSIGGSGGPGLASTISGSSVVYAVGGPGGNGGGSTTSSNGANATANTGNGGAGASSNGSGSFRGGNGGSGIVIISYSVVLTDYTLTFDKQNGTGGTNTASAVFNSTMPTATAPSRTGYTFIGYFDDPTSGTQYYNGAMASSRNWDKTENTTLYARWQANNNSIIFNGNNATSGSMANQLIASDTVVNLNTNQFIRSGFIFTGWNTLADGTGTPFADQAPYTMGTNASYTLFAQWSANTNQIVFNGNGATSGSMTAQGLNTGATANLNANQFERAGYTFAGWNTLADGTGDNFANQASYTMGTNASYTLFAKWTAINNTLIFDPNTATSGTMVNQIIATDATAVLNNNQFSKTGHSFLGWNTEPDGSGNSYTNQGSYTMGPSATNTLYAQWSQNQYTITLDQNFGNGGTTALTAIYNQPMPSNAVAPTRGGFVFGGYYTATNGGGTQYFNSDMTPQLNYPLTTNTTLFAKWTASITLAKPTLSSANSSSIFNFTDASASYALPAYSGNEIVMTTGGAQASAFFFNEKIILNNGFSTYFEIKQYRTSNNVPADGLVFVLSGDTNTIGGAGGGLGYLGITNSLGVSFDNHKNTGDPDPVFTTVYKDGNMSSLWNTNQSIRYDTTFVSNYSSAAVNALVRTYKVWLDYNLSTRELNFKIDVNGTITTYVFTGVDVPNEFYAGFTAGTGGASVKFAIPTWYFANSYYADGINPASTTETFVEDRTAPTSPNISLAKTNGNNSSLTINGSTDDVDGSNVSYQYSFDGNTWLNYLGTEVFDTSLYNLVYARSFDNAGNISSLTTVSSRFTLSFNSNDGSPVENLTEIPNASISRPTDPTRTGYSFVNWYSDVTLSNLFDFSSGISSNTIIYAKWQGLPFTVTFDKQTGTGGDDSKEVIFGSPMVSAAAPTKFGYDFNGYFSQINGQGDQYYNASMNSTRSWDIDNSTTVIYAHWTPKSILITFDKQSGINGTSSINATFASSMPSAQKPELTGHDFMGYFTQASGQGTQYYSQEMESLNNWNLDTATTLFAYYTPSDYTISFNANQGANLSFTSKIVIYNQNFGELPTVSRIGYDFAGWYDSSIGGNQITESTQVSITDDKEYFARWTPLQFTITFDPGLGTGGTPSILATYDSSLPVITAPTRSGYTFDGYTNSLGIQYYSNNLESVLSFRDLGAITLFAEWTPNRYTITFDPYGGTLTGFASKQVTFDETYGVLSTATRVGHTFAGWYTTQVAGFEVLSTDINTAFTNQTLYARWNVNSYNVNFITNGGTPIDSLSFDFGSNIIVPNAVKGDGYEFVSWYPTLPATMPASDLTLTAIYKRIIVDNSFSVTNINSNFKDGLVRFSLGLADPNARIFVDNEVNLASPGSNVNNGVISRNGNDLYYGTGSGLVRFGQIDSTHNGNNGSDLLVNINSTVLFDNGDFSNNFTNWTTNNSKYDITGNSTSGMTYQSSIVTSGSNKFARLYIAGTTDSLGSVHGPSLTSASFSAKPGDMISFKWKADANLDDYDVYAFLDNGGVLTELLYSRGGTQANFQTREITLTSEMLPNGLTDNLRFVFVAGSYDRNGGTGIGATFYIDDVSIVDNGVTANVINNLIKNIKYSGVEPNQFIDISTEDSTNSINYYLTNNESVQNQTEESNLNLRTSYSFLQNQNFSINLDLRRYFSNSSNISYEIVDPNDNLDGFVSINNNILSGSGNNSKVGNNTVYVKATAQNYQSSIIAFNIGVINVNDAPTINPVYQGYRIPIPFDQTFVYYIPDDFMLDPDVGTSLTYTVTGTLPVGISYKPETKSFSGRCNLCDLSNLITITASDGFLTVSDNNIGFTSSLTVIFESNGGSLVPSQTIQSGQAVVRPQTDPTRTGYTFADWYLDPSLSLVYGFTSTPPYGSVYAKWTPNKYNIRFNDSSGNVISEASLDFATTITPPTNPAMEGKIFDGWSPNVHSTVPASDTTYTAVFRNKEFGFLIHENHALALAPTLVMAEFGDDIELALEPPIRLGYTFRGWFADQALTIRNNVPKTMPDLGPDGTIINLYASWEPTKYAINYIGMLAPNSLNPTFYTIESDQIRFNTNLSNSTITFMGFYDNPAFTGTPITRIAAGSTGVVNLYANFIAPSYTLSFTDDEGKVLSSASVKVGTTIDTSFFPSTEKEGFEFIGWGANLPSVMPDSNVTVVGNFKAKEYKLTITDMNGTIIISEMFKVNESLAGIDLPEAEIEGFEFEGWEPELPSKMPASDLEITAKYRELPKFKIIIYGTQEEVLVEAEFKEKEEVTNVTLPDLSNSKDFEFEGWDGEIPTVMPGANIEIRPLGTKKEVILNLYSADRTLINSIQAQIGSKLSLSIPSRLGYNFAGWADSSGTIVTLEVMPDKTTDLFATWQAKIYTIQVTVGSNDFNINVTFGEPIGNIVSPQLFGFRFEGWKNNLTGQFLNSNTIFTTPEEINLVPVYTRLNAGETLIAATRLISDFILRLFR